MADLPRQNWPTRYCNAILMGKVPALKSHLPQNACQSLPQDAVKEIIENNKETNGNIKKAKQERNTQELQQICQDYRGHGFDYDRGALGEAGVVPAADL